MNVARIAFALGLGLASGRIAAAQETTRISVSSSGLQGDGGSFESSISADGQLLAFISWATNLVAGDRNGTSDILVHDRGTGTTERVSVSSSGSQGNGGCYKPAISADGQVVAFSSKSTNLVSGDTNNVYDVFVHERASGVTLRVSVDSFGGQGNDASGILAVSISEDGQIVEFESLASNLVSGDTNGNHDVFVHDRATGVTERVSVDSSGAQGNGDSYHSSITGDGRYVAFSSAAGNLVSGDTNGSYDVFVHDRVTGITERVSVDSTGAEGNQHSGEFRVTISDDGQLVAFDSEASNLVPGDANGYLDIFVHDRGTGVTQRVSVDSTGAEGNGNNYDSAISAGGRFVAFQSLATNLVSGDTNATYDMFVHDLSTGDTERVSVDSNGAQADRDSWYPSISKDGSIVGFSSYATNLVSADTNNQVDVFVQESCRIAASWSNYGSGFPGTNGVPAFTAQQNPVLGSTVTLDLANSYANPTIGLVFVGNQRALIPSVWGGDLLVDPTFVVPVTFSYGFDSFTVSIPDDRSLCGFVYDLQAIEADPGAARGVSFTQGLELVLGH